MLDKPQMITRLDRVIEKINKQELVLISDIDGCFFSSELARSAIYGEVSKMERLHDVQFAAFDNKVKLASIQENVDGHRWEVTIRISGFPAVWSTGRNMSETWFQTLLKMRVKLLEEAIKNA